MIIIKMMGGLGNQMFQYAASRALADRHGFKLKLDISGYKNQGSDTRREYGLDVFNLQADLADAEELRAYQPLFSKKWPRLIRGVGNRIFKRHNVWREISYDYDPSFEKIKDGQMIIAYLQSEKYFKDSASSIRQDFSLRPGIVPCLEIYKDRLKGGTPVSLHIRRGDYVTHKQAKSLLGALDARYYQEAVKIISGKIANPHYFIFAEFSEDIEWSRQNLSLPADTVFVEPQAIYQDLWLMSRCRHHIIANSSFSWWGAWLNPNPDKTVIAPRHWFRDKAFKLEDRLPENWLKI